MKILGLYNNNCAIPLFDKLEEKGHEVVRMSDRLDVSFCESGNFDLAVSYTYKYILPKEILSALSGNVVNLHNSYLPYNRGASPNLWSIAEDTPRGVTLHYMDAALDKGYVIARRLVTEGDGETLASSYANLDKNAIDLFMEAFEYYPKWQKIKKKVSGKGSYHSVADTKKLMSVIDSYDMKITDFKKALKDTGII